MKKEPAIAVVGATGIIGSEIVTLLNQRKFGCAEARLFASDDSAGEVYSVLGESVQVESLVENSFEGLDLVFLALNPVLVKEWAPAALAAGAKVIDLSGAYASQPEAVLLVVDTNPQAWKKESKIAVCASPAAAQLAPVLGVMQRALGLGRVVVASYESVSGAGKLGLDELWDQTRAVFSQQEIVMEAFPHQIAFNCIPQIDVLTESGDTRAELRLATELRSVLNLDQLRVSATAVRVPVLHGLAQALNVETERFIPVAELNQMFEALEGLRVLHAGADYPTMLDAVGNDEIFIGRVRKDDSLPCGYSLWVVADNLRRGLALNAVRIAELMVERA